MSARCNTACNKVSAFSSAFVSRAQLVDLGNDALLLVLCHETIYDARG